MNRIAKSALMVLILAIGTRALQGNTAGGTNHDSGATNTAPASTSRVDDTIRFPESISPGSTLTITGTFTGKDQQAKVKIHLVGSDLSKDPGIDPDTTKKVSDTQIDVKLPDKLAPGRYYLTLDYGDLQGKIIPGEVRISRGAVTLDSAHPTTAYSGAAGGFDFDIIGQGFSSNAKDNNVYVSGQGLIIKSWQDNKDACAKATSENKPCLWYDPQDPDKLHVVGYAAQAYQGPLAFRVQVGGVQSSAEKPLVLATMSPAGLRFWSILIFGVLALIVYLLVAQGLAKNVIDGERYSPFASFFLDKQTDTYSLSKFQLLLFSATFIFGYLYVFLCSWLVQWHFILPDVPTAFSGILGMSAGTTVIAAGATSARGSKGAGGTRPSIADFITTGGQVVPERFQYFVWTLVACFGFVALLLSQDPASISGFPDIPSGLLYVMGVSAGGYLAGKVTRAPGPVIQNISWDKTGNQLLIQGQNLSKEGDFFVDSKKLPIVPNATQTLIQSVPQEQASDRSFCSELKMKIERAAGLDLSTGDHVFRIMNKDAQFADARFTSDPPTIDAVSPVAPSAPIPVPAGADPKKAILASSTNTDINVAGSGFRAGTSAGWTPAGAKDQVEINAVSVKDSANLTLTLNPGGAGPARLQIITPNGFSAVAVVTVVDPASSSPPRPGTTTAGGPSAASSTVQAGQQSSPAQQPKAQEGQQQ